MCNSIPGYVVGESRHVAPVFNLDVSCVEKFSEESGLNPGLSKSMRPCAVSHIICETMYIKLNQKIFLNDAFFKEFFVISLQSVWQWLARLCKEDTFVTSYSELSWSSLL